MAEFCLECLNRMSGTSYTHRDVVLDEDFCEGCAQVKPCVVVLRRRIRIKLAIEDFLDTRRQLRERRRNTEKETPDF